MALYIRDDQVRELAAKLAKQQGLTVTEAVRAALLEAQRRLEQVARDAEAREVICKLRAMRHGPVREEVVYDEFGQPTLRGSSSTLRFWSRSSTRSSRPITSIS